jgi:AraC-like DNA-binding protein
VVGTRTSVFGEPDDFREALRSEGNLDLYVTSDGRFRARLTKVVLHRLSVAAVTEQLPRIGFMGARPDMVLISLPLVDQSPPIWGGIQPRRGEMMLFGPGHRFHLRTQGPCHWGAIWVPTSVLSEGFFELTGSTLTITHCAELRRPSRVLGGRLLRLHAAVIRAAEVRPETIVSAEAAHGMEQQLFHALVECLSVRPAENQLQVRQQDQEITARFENLLQARGGPACRVDKLPAALGVSDRHLRKCCADDLGMSPASYIQLRALHRVHDILRWGEPEAIRVSQVARLNGFRALGAFAARYRALFGELPSATLRRPLPMAALHSPKPTSCVNFTRQHDCI